MRSPPESWLIGRIRLPAGIAWKLWSAGPDGADGAVDEELNESMDGLGVAEGPTGNEGIQGFTALSVCNDHQPLVVYAWGEGEIGGAGESVG